MKFATYNHHCHLFSSEEKSVWNFPQTCSVLVPRFLGVLGTQYPKLDGLSECDKHAVMVSQIAATYISEDPSLHQQPFSC